MVTGSGQQDRNEEIGKHKPFLVIADYLSRNGIIVLRYDDRGTGGSTGNFNNSTTGDFASDALAAIAYLQGRSDLKVDHIGIIGHSEGGIAATIAASGSSSVEYIIALAGLMEDFEKIALNQLLAQSGQVGKTPDEIELERNWRTGIYEIAGGTTDSAEAAVRLWNIYKNLSDEDRTMLNWPEERHAAQIKQVLSPWWRYSLSIDNSKILKNVKCPVLALYGELDKQVNPQENMLFVKECIREGRKKNIEVRLLPGLNHLFQTAITGSEYEYIRLDETISPVALKLMAEWIKRN